MTKQRSFIDTIRKDYEGVLVEEENLAVIPTGSLSVDSIIGRGGIPVGRVSVLFGSESVGKTSLACSIARHAIALGYKVLYIDAENGAEVDNLKNLVGTLDVEKLVIIQPEPSDALEIAEIAIQSSEFNLIIFDSIAAIPNRQEEERDFSEATMGGAGAQLSKFFRRNMKKIREKEIAFLAINQVRDNFKPMARSYEMPGGHALKHFSSLILFMGKESEIKQGDIAVGIVVRVTAKKNKIASPFRSASFPLMFGKGINEQKDIIQFATTMGVLSKRGSNLYFGEEHVGQGLESACNNLIQHPELGERIRNRVLEVIPANKATDLEEEDNIVGN